MALELLLVWSVENAVVTRSEAALKLALENA